MRNEIVVFEMPLIRMTTQASYEAAVRDRLEELAARPNATLEAVAGAMRGVFPVETLSRVKAHHPELLKPQSVIAKSAALRRIAPELHPLDYEWYFTEETSQFVASTLDPVVGSIACLGAPTVAAAIADKSKSAVLIDASPFAIARIRSSPLIEWSRQDLRSELQIRVRMHGVFFDAPWYPEYVSKWLLQAVRIAAPGSVICFSLFPELTRPSARAERTELLQVAEQFGSVNVRKDALRYETPLFELEILKRYGLEQLTDWRSSDLVELTVANKPSESIELAKAIEDEWDTFLVGAQVVKLKKSDKDDDKWIISPLRAYPDYVGTTVSRRDPNRAAIDVWTSRNRVAALGNRERLAFMLTRLQAGESLEASLRATVGGMTSIDLHANRKRLESFLDLNFPDR